jgi:hypothetical protein
MECSFNCAGKTSRKAVLCQWVRSTQGYKGQNVSSPALGKPAGIGPFLCFVRRLKVFSSLQWNCTVWHLTALFCCFVTLETFVFRSPFSWTGWDVELSALAQCRRFYAGPQWQGATSSVSIPTPCNCTEVPSVPSQHFMASVMRRLSHEGLLLFSPSWHWLGKGEWALDPS